MQKDINFPTENKIKRKMQYGTTLALLATVIVALGVDCGGGGGGGEQFSISNGTIRGIDGWDVSASINIEPNRGPHGTPLTVTVDFSRGAGNVSNIEM